ncbi:uncharacterized protein LOC108112643 [Drosophila eugracilis]|uniref:uncharacterized protein LOC108112643 n=1 Tax=Drosophila eugracilis TaxID=29029 RepID=UPI0007E7DCF7|nr:uncharacterized protein LOC108112643 [Drosophila eugracilis]
MKHLKNQKSSIKMERASGALPGSRHRSWMQSFLRTTESFKTPGSRGNEFDMKSEATGIQFGNLKNLKDVTLQQGEQIVYDILGDIFDKKMGIATVSESECSLDEDIKESLSMDPRLKLWYTTLQKRASVQAKIQRKLGRRPDEMLINVGSTVAPRDRGTVQRLLDFAGRMNPTALSRKKPGVLTAQLDSQCRLLPELHETLPQAEQCGHVAVEIIGLTDTTKQEILGTAHPPPEKPSQWIKSLQLEKRIEKKSDDIKRVLPFFPSVSKLEVVGGHVKEKLSQNNSSNIERMSCKSIFSVSGSSEIIPDEEIKVELPQEPVPAQEQWKPRAAVKINGVLYFNSGKRVILPEIANVVFQCHPYQNELKEVARVENVGSQVLTCEWAIDCKRSGKCANHCQNFLMSHANFTVFPGEEQVCRVLFHPTSCNLLKQRYELRIFPNVIGSVRGVFLARLTGRCVPAPEYTNKLRRHKELITNRSKKLMADKVVRIQASIVPLLQPDEVVCPYERVLDEREVFNAENPGYKCERFDDLETLKALYLDLKKPREPSWDLRLETILEAILRLSDSNQRRLYYEKLIEVQEELKQGGGKGSLTHFGRSDQRIRSMFIYVRGCICNGIQEWEEMMGSMELSGLRLEINRYQAKLQDKEIELEEVYYEDEASEPKPWMRQLRKENLVLYLLKKLRSRKSYRDSLYMQTYSHLCDMAENVVSVIESTRNT